VPAAPEPAFVATGPAPAPEARAAPPGAIANRQPTAQASAPAARPSTPAARPAVAASEIARPEAAQSDSLAPELQAPAQPQGSAQPGGQAQQASLSAADLAKGRQLFGDFSCGACHLLADAGGSGSIGPSLDRNPNLTREFAASVIHDGRGAMPSFAGQISDPDIATLAAYIVQVSRK
jgi:mono/diheme cytochrome c family protein